MASNIEDGSPKTASQKLAELVARRKSAGGPNQNGVPGQQMSERDAAARSAAKSKPALRKG